MKWKIFILVIGFLVMGANVHAGGDLTVLGNLDVGSGGLVYNAVTGKVDTNGTLYVKGSRTDSDYTAFTIGNGPNSGGGFYIQADGNNPFVGFTGFDGGYFRDLFFGGTEWHVQDANRIRFYTDPSYTGGIDEGILRMNISRSGRVAIGNEQSPNALLEITADGSTAFDFLMLSSDDDNDGDRFIVKNSGNVGIGTTSPNYPLEMGGGAYTDGLDWYPVSSREYKENISDLTADKAMSALEELNPVIYNYKADTEDQRVGFIAEDVPNLVATKNHKALSPLDIVAVLTRVVQEQQKTISELSEKVKQLEWEVKIKRIMASADIKVQ